MGYLMKNPRVYQKLQAEVDQLEIHGTGPIKYSVASQAPYLSAACKEAFRMTPAIAVPLPRVVPRGGSVISGHFFPEGVIMIPCHLALEMI